MGKLYTLALIILFTGIITKSYATDGCYSLLSQRFYYVSIGTNDYSGTQYAVLGGTASCSTFTSGAYYNTLCTIEGTSNSNYRQATTNLIYPCPIDDYIPILILIISFFGFVILKRSAYCVISA